MEGLWRKEKTEHSLAGKALPEQQLASPVHGPTREQLDMIERQNAALETASAEDILKWAVETYRFDTALVGACVGERVVLNIFGVNAAQHQINIPDFGKSFLVKRGMLSRVAFRVTKPGLYPIVCITHQPSHRADLLVSSCA